MHDHQLLFIIKGTTTGLTFQSIVFHENGDMEVKFLDKRGNFHHQTITGGGILQTHEY